MALGPVQSTFSPPTQALPYFLVGRLRAWEIRGLSVWRLDGEWHQGFTPSAAVRASADRFYLGGVDHALTLDEQNDLIAGGYGDYITHPPAGRVGSALVGSASITA